MRWPLEIDNPLGSVDPFGNRVPPLITLVDQQWQVNSLFNWYPSFDASMTMALNPML